MASWFLDRRRQLRNGWKCAAFVGVAAMLLAAAMAGLQALPVPAHAHVPKVAVLALAMLLATWVSVRAEGRPLASVGLVPDARFAGQLGLGWVGGGAAVVLIVLIGCVVGGFDVHATSGAAAAMLLVLAKGAALQLGVAVMEELIYRGYAFQRALLGMGVGWTQVVFAALFCASHPLDATMGPATASLATANLFLFAIVMGLCTIRTGSLAMPVGAHAGWNWAQQGLGFGVSGIRSQGAWSPVFRGKPDWLTGGSFGIEASAIALVVLAVVAASLTAWRPNGRAAPPLHRA